MSNAYRYTPTINWRNYHHGGSVSNDDIDMVVDQNGEYVDYSAYEALEANLTEEIESLTEKVIPNIREQRMVAEERLEQLQRKYNELQKECSKYLNDVITAYRKVDELETIIREHCIRNQLSAL